MEEPTYIQYLQSPVGLIKISGSAKYISEVKFIDDQQDIPDTEPAPDIVRSCARQLTEYFNGSRRQFDIPISQEGSEFQQKVWGKLTDIPFGRTINYLDLAKRLGDPKKIRAAATTNGKNRIAVIIPCHRVIGSNGTLVGYAGGLWRKKWLLEHENKIANGLQTLF